MLAVVGIGVVLYLKVAPQGGSSAAQMRESRQRKQDFLRRTHARRAKANDQARAIHATGPEAGWEVLPRNMDDPDFDALPRPSEELNASPVTQQRIA